MKTDVVLTLVHVSDIHIGAPIPSGDAAASNWWQYVKHLDGLLGHEYRALVYLDSLFREFEKAGPTELVVTGDITSKGDDSEFAIARDYLSSRYDFTGTAPIGLRCRRWRANTVPGNHDHWPGSARIWGAPTKGFRKVFNTPKLVNPAVSLNSGHTLQIIRIDSDADVDPLGSDRFFARGDFSSQLSAAEPQLPAIKAPNAIRVVLMHHSMTHTAYLLGMTRSSRRHLDEFLVRNGIDVVLSGHVHVPLVRRTVIGNASRPVTILDARCGTSAQRSGGLYAWQRRPQRGCPNSVLVHQIVKLGKSYRWRTSTYYQSPQGFQPAPSLPDLSGEIPLP